MLLLPDMGVGPLFGTGREANLVLLDLLHKNSNPVLGFETELCA